MGQHKLPKKPPPPDGIFLQVKPEFAQWVTQRAKQSNLQPAEFMALVLDLGAQLVLGFDKMDANNLPPMQPAAIFNFNNGRQIQVLVMYTDAKAGLILPETARRKLN